MVKCLDDAIVCTAIVYEPGAAVGTFGRLMMSRPQGKPEAGFTGLGAERQAVRVSASESTRNSSSRVVLSTGDLTCQWCSVRLLAGETRCPTCGSPGIPDPNLHPPGVAMLEAETVPDIVEPKEELTEWWLDEDEVQHQQLRAALSPAAVEDRLFRTAGVLIGTAVVFTFLGWLVGPMFLSPLMENITGSPVEHASDLRPMGGILGLLTGLFFGASYGWIAGAER